MKRLANKTLLVLERADPSSPTIVQLTVGDEITINYIFSTGQRRCSEVTLKSGQRGYVFDDIQFIPDPFEEPAPSGSQQTEIQYRQPSARKSSSLSIIASKLRRRYFPTTKPKNIVSAISAYIFVCWASSLVLLSIAALIHVKITALPFDAFLWMLLTLLIGAPLFGVLALAHKLVEIYIADSIPEPWDLGDFSRLLYMLKLLLNKKSAGRRIEILNRKEFVLPITLAFAIVTAVGGVVVTILKKAH